MVGSLTSLATVYVFFLGTSKVFGWVILIAPASLFVSYVFTNYATKKIIHHRTTFANRLASEEQTAAVIANIFWSDTTQERFVSRLAKYISLLSMSAFIWLEFSVFAALTTAVLDITSIPAKGGAFFIASFVVFFIIMRYGLRGFVYADLFQAPVTLLRR